LPRRYHRPPAAKRRKPKRNEPQTPYQEPPQEDPDSPVLTTEEDLEEWDDGEEEFGDSPATAAVATAVRPAPGRERTQHVQRDFSYVRTELIRVAAVGTFLVVSLIITAILR
jgi:hypothetical protein